MACSRRTVVHLAASDSHDASASPGGDPLSPAIGTARTSSLLPAEAWPDWMALRQVGFHPRGLVGSEVDGEFTVSAQELEVLDRARSVGRYLFLEQLDRVPLGGGVALTGLLPIPGINP